MLILHVDLDLDLVGPWSSLRSDNWAPLPPSALRLSSFELATDLHVHVSASLTYLLT